MGVVPIFPIFPQKSIRISHCLIQMPEWVRDYVILHEMAHLIEPNHSKSFWNIVSHYSLSERAKGYLIAKGFEIEDKSDLEENGLKEVTG